MRENQLKNITKIRWKLRFPIIIFIITIILSGMSLSIFCGSLLIKFILGIISNPFLLNVIPIIILASTLIGIFLPIKFLIYIDPFEKLERETGIMYKLIGSKSKIDNINIILSKTQQIYKYIYLLKYFQQVNYLFSKQSQNVLEELKIFIEFTIYPVLTDLRSDLSIRLNEQKQSLESAKSEVESNIQGTTELNQVSELQRARLDRQIEQFEELQRVLVKV